MVHRNVYGRADTGVGRCVPRAARRLAHPTSGCHSDQRRRDLEHHEIIAADLGENVLVAEEAHERRVQTEPAVLVADDGPFLPQATAGTSVGIRGMRERAESTGGTFQAGTAPGGGFLVRAEWAARS